MRSLKNFRFKFQPIYLIIFFLLAYIVNEGLINSGGEDFRASIGASRAFWQKSNLYFNEFDIDRNKDRMAYSYTPFWAYLLMPLTYLFSDKTIIFLWLLSNLFFLYRIFNLLNTIINPSNRNKFIVLLFLLTVRYIMHNLDLSQLSIFWVYLMIESFYQYEYKNRILLSLGIIALGTAIKFMPLLFLYYLFIKRDYKSILLVIVFIAILSFLPFTSFSFDYLSLQYKFFWTAINPTKSSFMKDWATQSIPSIVYYYCTKFNIPIDELKIKFLIDILRLALLFWFYNIYQGIKDRKLKTTLLLSLCCIGASLFMPHQQQYSFFSAIGLLSIWTYWITEKKGINKLAYSFFILSMILYIGTSELFVGRDWTIIAKTYKLIGISSILLILATHIQLIHLSKTLHQT